jgi:hypothetical protein
MVQVSRFPVGHVPLCGSVHLASVLIDQRLSLGAVEEDSESIIRAPSKAETIDTQLPVHVTSELVVNSSLLPCANSLLTSDVAGATEPSLPVLIKEPSVLFRDDGLLDLVLELGMGDGEVGSPGDLLAPPIRVQVECAKVDVGELDKRLRVNAICTVVRPIV